MVVVGCKKFLRSVRYMVQRRPDRCLDVIPFRKICCYRSEGCRSIQNMSRFRRSLRRIFLHSLRCEVQRRLNRPGASWHRQTYIEVNIRGNPHTFYFRNYCLYRTCRCTVDLQVRRRLDRCLGVPPCRQTFPTIFYRYDHFSSGLGYLC